MLASMTDAKLGSKRVPRAIREQQMLDAAVAEFARLGFHDASMDDIAAGAHVSKPMVYAYLGTKDDLFVACLHREATRLMQSIADVVDPDLGPEAQLWEGLRAFFGFVAAHRDGWTVLYRQAQGPFAQERARMRARTVEVVAGMMSRVIEADGHRPRKADLDALAHALVGASESLADWQIDNPSESPDTTASRLMNIVWLGAANLLNGAVWHSPAPPNPS